MKFVLSRFRGSHAFGFGLFAALLLFGLPANAQVAVTINGNPVDIAPSPILQGGRVFVPLRGVFEQLGATVVYSNGTINATGNGRTISLQIGSTQAIVDGQTQLIDVAPFIVGESTYVPLRFISESLGADVEWDGASNTVAIGLAGASSQGAETVSDTVDLEPPPIPVYDQPEVPQPNDIWQPGYWAWGAYGYYWVPGTWVAPPQPGYLWTPGYWNRHGGNFVWIAGYWATAVGFYGGINYGAGYDGHGYSGGRWSGRVFQYNTYVTRVNNATIKNVYVDKTVIVNNSNTRVSYNGGPNGLQARPTAQEARVARLPHLGVTSAQEQHDVAAAHDRQLLATVNHNRPPVLAVARPLSTDNRPAGFTPIKPTDRVTVPVRAAPAYHAEPATARPAAPAYHLPAKATPEPRAANKPAAEYHPPSVKPAPAYHPQQRETPASRPATARPESRPAPAPAYHPAVRVTPEYHPPVRATPAPYHPPVRVTPEYHAPPQAAAPPRAAPPPTVKKPPPAEHPHPTEPPK